MFALITPEDTYGGSRLIRSCNLKRIPVIELTLENLRSSSCFKSIPEKSSVIVYTSIDLFREVKLLRPDLNWLTPVIGPFDTYMDMIDILKNHCVNSDAKLSKRNMKYFCRPNDWFKTPLRYTQTVVASKKIIHDEIRCFIATKTSSIITASYYQPFVKELKSESALFSHLQKRVSDLEIDTSEFHYPIYSIDFGLHNEEWKVVEIQGFTCCDLYECDTDLLVDAFLEI